MPIINPVSELKNYTAILNQVSYDNRIYLTTLMGKLNDAKASVREEGTISADDLEKELGVKQ